MEALWLETPLIYATHISDLLGCSAYLKLENLQPSQSFKYRGISRLVQLSKAQHGPSVHILVASTGNAGLAAAIAARKLGVKCTIYLPFSTREETQVRLLKQGAKVLVVGQIYADSVAAMREEAKADPNAVILPSYESPVLWEGHSSMVKEMKNQLGEKPDAILCSVGGGGLIGGLLLGCKAVNWDDVPLIALETHGSNCFYQANAVNTQGFTSKSCTFPPEIPNDQSYTKIEINSEHSVAIPHLRTLHSRALSLGATYAAPEVVRMALDHPAGVKCVCIADELAMRGAQLLANDHKMLVELACATTISAAYNHEFFWRLLDPESALSPEEKRKKTVVFVVCGGINICYDEAASYTGILKEAAAHEDTWRIICNGTEFHVNK
ncbi:tryptophan synthase beta subunit-like PLP-dependent enzyme [Pisolithus orientalis]|uniref:tryptophan synthase beta subunit-like PLP-dependent enzyme n=1 Tax=Pisolithus orientalis TaxID=936130 RepID=UPI002225A632|nr:tryptophan synthase beta subunit-like PLP-dependent enzyme [Pisolithus orientalis]KAI6028313.1 tryptophan synthase beta subunit-like PLP-dependent enzyme [Pisolithus orientalis]